MPLLGFWKSNRDEVLTLTIEQVVSSAGDGNLRDNSSSCEELRQFLRMVPSQKLFDYARPWSAKIHSKKAASFCKTSSMSWEGDWISMLRTAFIKEEETLSVSMAFGVPPAIPPLSLR
jgi:hypothetical protein